MSKATHISRMRTKWKCRGVIWDNEEEYKKIYNRYIASECCELCNKPYKNSSNRCLDHDHKTGLVRNIVCRRCNTLKKDTSVRKESSTGEKNITKCKAKEYTSGYCYWVEFSRDGKKICQKRNATLEKAILYRDNFIKENPTLFT